MRRYPAKLLLFGEHVLLLGAPALCVPVPAFGGHWDWRSPDTPTSAIDMRLLEFSRSAALRGIPELDTRTFEADLGMGLYFHSDIPSGYGLGSSGALCAAIYDRYAAAKTDDPAALKVIFSVMESFFHGNSSGLDPLTSYLDEPLIVQHTTEVSRAECSAWQPQGPVVFLIDSRLPRRTGPMVEWFRGQWEQPDFRTSVQERYLPWLERTIAGWQAGEPDAFLAALAEVSAFQYEVFAPLVPGTVRNLWRRSFEEGVALFKLCGAGGGGYLLGFARTAEAARLAAHHHPLVFPFDKKLSAA